MWKEVTWCVWSSMQRLSEHHCCAGRHQAMTDLEKKSFRTPAPSSCLYLNPVTLLPRLSCLSFVHLGRCLCKMGLSQKCVAMKVKRSSEGSVQCRSTVEDSH